MGFSAFQLGVLVFNLMIGSHVCLLVSMILQKVSHGFHQPQWGDGELTDLNFIKDPDFLVDQGTLNIRDCWAAGLVQV